MSRGQLTKALKVVEWNSHIREVRALARQIDQLETEVEYLHKQIALISQTLLLPAGKKLGQ